MNKDEIIKKICSIISKGYLSIEEQEKANLDEINKNNSVKMDIPIDKVKITLEFIPKDNPFFARIIYIDTAELKENNEN